MTTPTRENEMEDKELLELAAKAAGYELHIWGTPGMENVARMDAKPSVRWNPLTDDGDALRLAVKLGLQIVTGGTVVVQAIQYGTEAYGEALRGDDPYAATRRAIVRAAAEIGKSLPTPTIRSPEALSNSTQEKRDA